MLKVRKLVSGSKTIFRSMDSKYNIFIYLFLTKSLKKVYYIINTNDGGDRIGITVVLLLLLLATATSSIPKN